MGIEQKNRNQVPTTLAAARSAPTNFPHSDIRVTAIKKTFSVLVLFVILALAWSHITSFFDTFTKIYEDPKNYNLTKSGVEWDIYYGAPELCGKVECHLMSSYSSKNFTRKGVLPSREFPLKGYKPGQIIYYRTTLNIPEKLISDDQIIVFHSLYVWAESYRFYINGHFVDAGSKGMLTIQIPKFLIPPDGVLHLAMRIDPGTLRYQGLAHMGDLLVGPKLAFAPLAHMSHDLTHSFYLWHVLPRLTISLVFIFFFFAASRGSEMFMYIVYSFVGASHMYLLSDLPSVTVGEFSAKASISPILAIVSSLLFFALVHRFFRCKTTTLTRVCYALAGIIVLLSSLYIAQTDIGVAHSFLNKFNFGLRMTGSVFAMYMAFTIAKMLWTTGKSPTRLRASIIFFVFNTCVLLTYTLALMQVIPPKFGISTIFVSDTLLMILFTALVGQEFGSTLLQRDHIKNTFKRFVGSSIVDRMVMAGKEPEPKEQDVSVMFCDIRSFTTMCESWDPKEVFKFLNEYLETMVTLIAKHGGFIDKFGGDNIMAIWGAPDINPHHAVDAAQCAIAMRANLVEFNKRREARGEQAIQIGIGIHTGNVVAGAIGSRDRREYTVIGDTVNTASRVEGLTKEFKTDILVSASTWANIQSFATGNSVGSAKIKGRNANVEVFALESMEIKDFVISA